ncbi:MAG TPA: hypothetical protein VEN81_04565 [Planctomycetota bacterium]|nr:hypothetical protein [Planctomycetota bacterium]
MIVWISARPSGAWTAARRLAGAKWAYRWVVAIEECPRISLTAVRGTASVGGAEGPVVSRPPPLALREIGDGLGGDGLGK